MGSTLPLWVVQVLSAPRFDGYRAAAAGDVDAGVALYRSNVEVSAAFVVSTTTVSAVCDLQTGPGRFDDNSDASTPVVVPRCIRHNRIDDAGVVASLSGRPAERYRLIPGDIVCVRVGQIGRSGLVSADQEGWLLGPGCLRIRPSPDVDPRYLTHCLGTAAALDWLDRHATGSAIRGISARVLGEMPLFLPALEDQHRIGALLGTLDDEVDILERAATVTSKLRSEMAELLIQGHHHVAEPGTDA